MAYQARPDTSLRGLKTLVALMGVLIVVGTAVVIGVIIKRIYATKAAASISDSVLPGAPAPVLATSSLGPGEHIAGIAGAGGEFAVWVSGAGGDRLLLLNPQTGALSTVLAAPK